jgi:hypothetical protein
MNKKAIEALNSAIHDLAKAAANIRKMTEKPAAKQAAKSKPALRPKAKLKPKSKPTRAKASRDGLDGAHLLDLSGLLDSDEEDELAKFRAKPSAKRDGGRHYASKQPVPVGVKKNNFKPDPAAFLKAAAEDRERWEGREPEPRTRKKVELETVRVTCERCQRSYEAEPWDVNKQVKGDEVMENVCQRCIGNLKG